MEYPGEKGDGRTGIAVKGLHGPTTATNVSSQTKREATSPRHSHHERPWDASLVPASTGPNSRNTGGYTFVWVPKGTQLRGRYNPMLQSTLQGRHANMDPGRGHQILLRSCMLMPPSRTREARQCMPGEKHGIRLTW